MITYTAFILPVITGIIAGLFYGYSFVLQQRSIFFYANQTRATAFFIARVIIMVIAGSYLLQSPKIPSILGLLGFTIVFWAILLTTKAKLYEGH